MGQTFFLTVRLRERGSRALIDGIDDLRAAVRQVMRERPFHIDCAVVMPDHLHMIVTLPDGDAALGLRGTRIKALFSRGQPAAAGLKAREVQRGEKGVWQRGFWWHKIDGPVDLAAHREWMIEAPVRAGLVARASDWPWGSGRGTATTMKTGKDVAVQPLVATREVAKAALATGQAA